MRSSQKYILFTIENMFLFLKMKSIFKNLKIVLCCASQTQKLLLMTQMRSTNENARNAKTVRAGTG